MRFEVVIGREHFGADEFFLQDGHKIEQIFRVVVADVVDLVRREREAVFAVFLFGGMLHHADDAFDDVIDVGEVALAFAVVENLDGLAGLELVGEAEVGHVRTTCGTVNGKESQSRAWDVVELAVGMCHELVAFLCGCVQRYRIVHFVIGGVGDFLVAAVDARRTRVYKVLDFIVAAGFQDVIETDEVALDIGIWIRDGIADTCLSREIHDNSEMVFLEQAVDSCLVGEIPFYECPLFACRISECFDFFKALVLDIDVVVISDGVEANEFGTVVVGQQLLAEVASDKSCSTRD